MPAIPFSSQPSKAEGLLTGPICVLPTPFDEIGRVDFESLGRTANYAIERGARGVVCFGLASEGFKLNDAERLASLLKVIDTVNGRVPVVAGSENNSVQAAATRTREYVEAGASAVMVTPPSFTQPRPSEIVDYYRFVGAAASGAQVIVQDAPAWTGVDLPISVLEEIKQLAPNVNAVKVENPPNHQKFSDLSQCGFDLIGGFGALHLMEDIDAGISSVMCGPAFIDEIDAIWDSKESNSEYSWMRFEKLLPILAFQMSSLNTFIATQKQFLHEKGVISSTMMRPPGKSLSKHQMMWLEFLTRRAFPTEHSRTNVEKEHSG